MIRQGFVGEDVLCQVEIPQAEPADGLEEEAEVEVGESSQHLARASEVIHDCFCSLLLCVACVQAPGLGPTEAEERLRVLSLLDAGYNALTGLAPFCVAFSASQCFSMLFFRQMAFPDVLGALGEGEFGLNFPGRGEGAADAVGQGQAVAFSRRTNLFAEFRILFAAFLRAFSGLFMS